MVGQIDNSLISRNIQWLRKVNGLTQMQLAEGLYCDVRQVRRYEHETINCISVVNDVARYFNVSAIDLMTKDMSNVKPAVNAGF